MVVSVQQQQRHRPVGKVVLGVVAAVFVVVSAFLPVSARENVSHYIA